MTGCKPQWVDGSLCFFYFSQQPSGNPDNPGTTNGGGSQIEEGLQEGPTTRDESQPKEAKEQPNRGKAPGGINHKR